MKAERCKGIDLKKQENEYKHLVINLTEQDWKDLSTLVTKGVLKILAERKTNSGKVD